MSELKLCVLNRTVCTNNIPQNADPSYTFWVVVDIFNEKERLLIPDFFVFKCYIARQPTIDDLAKKTVGEHSKQNTAKCGC